MFFYFVTSSGPIKVGMQRCFMLLILNMARPRVNQGEWVKEHAQTSLSHVCPGFLTLLLD